MKKIKYIIFLGSLIIPTITTLAVEAIVGQIEMTPYTLENREEEDKNSIEANSYVTWEVMKNDLMIEDNFKRYELLINNELDVPLTYGKVAQLICTYIGRAPISLPQKDGGSSGYIGRLVMEGIWGDLPTDMNLILGQAEWDMICTRAKAFLLDPVQYEKDFLNSLEQEKKARITEYKLKEKTLGKLDPIELGEMTLVDPLMIYQEMPIHRYTYLNQDYIALQEVATLGLQVEEIGEIIYIRRNQEPMQSFSEKVYDKQKIAFNKKEMYIGNVRTYSLATSNDVFIPLEALGFYYEIQEEDGQIILVDKAKESTTYLTVDKNFITNNTEEILQVQLINFYWNGHEVLEEKWDISQLQPGEIYPNYNKVYTLNDSKIYLTTIINKVKIDNEMIWHTSEDYGQANKGLLSHYVAQVQKREEAKKQAEIEATKELFPASIIIGTMKYDVGPFKKGDQVEVNRADDGIRYYLHYGKDIVKVPWNSVKIPPNPRVETKQATIKELEDYINGTDMTSATNFLVWTDLYRQRTYIFNKQDGQWKIFRDKITKNDQVERPAILTCSTGYNVTPTPKGIFKLKAYVPYFGVNKGYRCKNAVQIFDDYLYHSLIFDKTGSYLLEKKGALGQRASQGCIRFSPEESEWFYNTMPLQTTVWIN
ncbi:MAG: L,D-transpeptidase [Cellulosilyticaceae bacterium]